MCVYVCMYVCVGGEGGPLEAEGKRGVIARALRVRDAGHEVPHRDRLIPTTGPGRGKAG